MCVRCAGFGVVLCAVCECFLFFCVSHCLYWYVSRVSVFAVAVFECWFAMFEVCVCFMLSCVVFSCVLASWCVCCCGLCCVRLLCLDVGVSRLKDMCGCVLCLLCVVSVLFVCVIALC